MRYRREKNARSSGISVVIPVYGCSACLPELWQRIRDALDPLQVSYEMILVNDASPDGAWRAIQELALQDGRVKGINLSRNFGQHYAITAGLDHAAAEWVVVMDCDLQDQPEEIPKLHAEALRGFDIVVGRRHERKDSFLKKTGSRLFYMVFDYLTDQKSDTTVANFGIYHRRVIDNVQKLREHNRNFPLFIRWLGFRATEIDIEHAPRTIGTSAYNFGRLFNLAIDSIVSQSNKPLRLSIKTGFVLSMMSMLYAMYLIIKYFFWGVPVAGWTSVMVSMYFIAGLLLANMGMLGLYIGKIFDETKARPLYVVRDRINLDQDEDEAGKITS